MVSLRQIQQLKKLMKKYCAVSELFADHFHIAVFTLFFFFCPKLHQSEIKSL